MSETSSQVNVLEKPDAPRHGLKHRIVDRFRHKHRESAPREVLEELSQDTRLESELPHDQLDSQGNPAEILTPEETYRNFVGLLQPSAGDEFMAIKTEVDAKYNQTVRTEEKTRKFGPQDKLRHKALYAIAKVQGVNDAGQFHELVEFIESSISKTEDKIIEFPTEPTQEEKERLMSTWEKKGYNASLYDFQPSYSKEGGYSLHLTKNVPDNVTKKDIGTLKAILESGERPVETLKALRGMGLHMYGLPLDEELPRLTELLKTAGSPDALEFIKAYSTLPQNTYLSIGNYGNYYEANRFIDMVNTGTIKRYDVDFFDKAGTIARALGTNVSLNSMDFYRNFIDDPSKFNLVVTALNRGYINHRDGGALHRINEMSSNTLNELTTCMRATIQIHPCLSDTLRDVGYLNQFLEMPDVQDFIKSPEKQDFARVAGKITGWKIGIKELNEIFDDRVDLIYLYSVLEKGGLIDPGKSEQGSGYSYGDSPLKSLSTSILRREPAARDVLLDPGFQQFLAEAKKQGAILEPIDIRRIRWSDHTLEILNLYRAKDMIKYSGDDIFDLMRNSNAQGEDQPENADIKVKCLSYIRMAACKETFELLQKYELLPEHQDLESILRTQYNSPFLKKDILSQIPEEMRREWIKGSLTLPLNIQDALLTEYFNDRRANYVRAEDVRITPGAIQRFNEVVDLFKNSEFVKENSSGLIEVLADYSVDVRELFLDGLPTAGLAEWMIGAKQFHQVSELSYDPRFLEPLDDLMRANLITMRGISPFLQSFLTDADLRENVHFPHLPRHELDKFTTLSKLCNYRQVNYIEIDFFNLFINYKGDPASLFDGKPTKEFIDLLAKAKLSENLPFFLTDEVLARYEGGEREALTLYRDLPGNIRKIMLDQELDFPVVPSEDIQKYQAIHKALEFSKVHNVHSAILLSDLEALRGIPERCPWFSVAENSAIVQYIFYHPTDFLSNDATIDFINQVQSLAGENSLSLLEEYRRCIVNGVITPEDKSLILDFAHVFKDPQSSRDPALRRGYRMMGDYLTLDSYRFLKGVMNGSISDEVLQGMGVTQKGEEGAAQLESAMQGFILGLTSGKSNISLLEHEIFSDFFKSYVRYDVSAWGNHSSDNFSRTIQTIQRLKENNPGILISDLPSSGIQEIAKLERAKTNESTFTESFLSRYGTLKNNIQMALDAINQPKPFSGIADNIKAKIDEQVLELQGDLEKNKDKPQAQSHIQKRIDKLMTVDPRNLKSFQTNFSALAQEKVFNDLLMQAVFAYTLQKFPEQRERMIQATGSDVPTVDSISTILDFTGHMVTKEAWGSYFTDKNARRAFQNILDTKEINDGLSRLLGEGITSRNYTPVEFVPTRGVLMEFSGYIADACWASRYESSVGQFPNITTVVMQDVSKEVPKLLGSSLLIETVSTDGTPLLIIRGLNPLESYINHVDIPDFYGKFTDYIKRIAESKGRKAAIVIDDHAGGSSTNRPLLYNFLKDQKGNLAQIGVSPNDTTFNGYNISNNTFLL